MDSARLEEQVAAVERAAEACLGGGDSGALVSQLGALKGADVTVEVLTATGGAKRLKKVAKSLEAGGEAAAEAASAAKDVVASWSARISQALAAQSPGVGEGDGDGPAAKRLKTEAPHTAPPAPAAAEVVRRPPPKLENSNRVKHRDLLTAALRVAESEGVQGDPDWVGALVEAELFAKFLPSKGSPDFGSYQESGGGSSKDYKVKFRQLSFNLKDGNNPDLRRSVLLGEVTPEELLALSSEELGSSARREENLKIRERAMWECERGQQQLASTDAFQCGKCKQRKTTYFQLQTRSADEPMTTFVTCVFPGCGNRWKFC